MSLQVQVSETHKSNTAEKGAHHWWLQRITSLALIPLTFWFVFSVISITGADHKTVVAEISLPLNAILIILLIVVAFYHAALGMQVVFEDYVSTIKIRNVCIAVTRLLLLLLAIVAIVAVVSIVFGAQ